MHQHKQPAPAIISTNNTSSRAGQQRQQHQRSSIKQQQDQNGNTENTNMIPKMQQKPSAWPKNIKILFIVDWVNLVFVTLPSEHGHSLQLCRGRYDLTRGLVRDSKRNQISLTIPFEYIWSKLLKSITTTIHLLVPPTSALKATKRRRLWASEASEAVGLADSIWTKRVLNSALYLKALKAISRQSHKIMS